MKVRISRRYAPLLLCGVFVALGAALAPPPNLVHATCFIECRARLVYEDCALPALAGLWPAGVPLTLTASCRTCCSPPGGPLTCEDTPVGEPETTLSLRVADSETVLEPIFVPLHLRCDGLRIQRFDGPPLAPGHYWLMRGAGDILVDFRVPDGPTPSPSPTATATPGPSPTPTMGPVASRLHLPLAIRR